MPLHILLFALLQIIYDLDQLPSDHRIPLRDTIIAALKNASISGTKVIITQLALALVDLLLQLPEWTNGLQDMIDQFGKAPETVPALLDFLKLLPQEAMSNVRIRITVGRVVAFERPSKSH